MIVDPSPALACCLSCYSDVSHYRRGTSFLMSRLGYGCRGARLYTVIVLKVGDD